MKKETVSLDSDSGCCRCCMYNAMPVRKSELVDITPELLLSYKSQFMCFSCLSPASLANRIRSSNISLLGTPTSTQPMFRSLCVCQVRDNCSGPYPARKDTYERECVKKVCDTNRETEKSISTNYRYKATKRRRCIVLTLDIVIPLWPPNGDWLPVPVEEQGRGRGNLQAKTLVSLFVGIYKYYIGKPVRVRYGQISYVMFASMRSVELQ
jgi:hypothetical protein